MDKQVPDRPYTAAEVAAKLGANVKTVYAAIQRGEIPSIKVGRLVLVPRRAFDSWFETGKAA